MNPTLHHLVAQLRMEEIRQQAERARNSDDECTSSPPRRTRARTWVARHWHHPAAAGTRTRGQPGEVPR